MRNREPTDGVHPEVTELTHAAGALAGGGERSLLDAFRSGDLAAFEEIVSLHRRRLFAIALRRTGTSTIAEDAVQVAFVQAWKHLPRMTGEVDLSAWLTSVVHNAALDQIRRDKRQARLAQRAHDASPDREERRGTERAGPATGVHMMTEELGAILLDGVRKLPEPYRVALTLFHVQGCTIEDISRTLGLNENTVKSHLARGRGMLRKRLGVKLERGGWL